jgi:hypothetical protein
MIRKQGSIRVSRYRFECIFASNMHVNFGCQMFITRMRFRPRPDRLLCRSCSTSMPCSTLSWFASCPAISFSTLHKNTRIFQASIVPSRNKVAPNKNGLPSIAEYDGNQCRSGVAHPPGTTGLPSRAPTCTHSTLNQTHEHIREHIQQAMQNLHQAFQSNDSKRSLAAVAAGF